MTPLVNGTVHHFEFAGLYDGVSILRDRETGSLWNHITGQSVYGPLAGETLPSGNLLHTTVEQALALYPDLHIALSDRPMAGRRSRWSPWAERIPVLGQRFKSTMAPEDTRRPAMDVGLGVWTATVRRYYPLDTILARDRVVIDELDGRRLAILFESGAQAPTAIYVDAASAQWTDGVLEFDNGDEIREGVLYDRRGNRRAMERPMQLFTRWYGFALTFPGTEIFGEGK